MKKLKEYFKRIAEALESIAESLKQAKNKSQPGGPGQPKPPGGG